MASFDRRIRGEAGCVGASDAMAKHGQRVAEDAAVGEQAACEGTVE
ncbi:MAG: hypothetical protein H8E35_14965 [Ardenticatenia bacterium]|nr:hypothetical protein [Ardenticatenia bacterium]